MFNVVLTKKDGTQYYISSNGKFVITYNDEESILFEFEDYEDAKNVALEFISKHKQKYDEGIISIEVEQM